MPATPSGAAVRSAAFISTLLVSTAFTVPAFAQIETVVVTAERKAEDIQTVPIAVSAFSSADLKAHQIYHFKDLQFAIPNLTFTKGNFGGGNFQIRGIGSAAISTSGDAGVAILENDIYLSSPPTATGTYFDVQDIEVLRGPQSTLYGRSATGGAVTITTKVPDLDNYSAEIEGTYGNFDDKEARGAVNIPLIDGQLAVRVAAFYENKGGNIKNIYPTLAIGAGSGVANNIDSRNDYSYRTSVRWQPSERTTLDVMYEYGSEADSRVRMNVQACHRDPSGILGCLPDHLGFEPVNTNATFGNTSVSDISLPAPLNLINVLGPGADLSNATTVVPSDMRSVNSDFTPHSHGFSNLVTAHLHQTISSWLNLDVNVGFNNSHGSAQQAYGSAGEVLPQARLATAEFVLCTVLGSPNCTAFGLTAHPGELPISNVGPWNPVLKNSGFGLATGNIRDFSNKYQAYDQISGHDREWTGEVRLATNFEGPFNFLVGGNHLMNQNDAEYFVNATTLDFFGVFFGGLSTIPPFPVPGVVAIIGPTQYDNNNKYFKLNSDSIYAEANYDIIPDELKLTMGGRFTHDVKHFESRQTLFSANTVYGPASGGFFSSFSPTSLGLTDALYDSILPMATPRTKTSDYLSGHAVLKWSPKLDFTDQTQVYLSLSHGARPGGFNPPSFSGLFKDTFGPEFVDAIELGSKNALFDNTVVANITLWAYSYRGYQISKIIDRTSVQSNINARLWGAEGEFFWTPIDQLQLNMNVGYNGSTIGNSTSFDTRNPSQGQAGATVVKDWLGSNCTIFSGTGLPGSAPTPSTPGFVGILADGPVTGALVGDNGVQIAEHVSYLDNLTAKLNPLTPGGLSCGTTLNNYLATYNALHGTNYSSSSGVEANLHGNKMQNTPPVTLNFGVQYTFMIDGDYSLVPRFDVYWKDSSWASIFNAPTDRIPDWYTANAQMQFNAPDSQWYVRGWVTNLFDGKQVTGSYVTNDGSGLYTNLFAEEPRTYGITLGAHF